MGPKKRRERKKGPEKKFEDITVEKFPKLGKKTVIQVQEAQRVQHRINPKRNTSIQIVIKITKIKYIEKILKAAREKQQIK